MLYRASMLAELREALGLPALGEPLRDQRSFGDAWALAIAKAKSLREENAQLRKDMIEQERDCREAISESIKLLGQSFDQLSTSNNP